MSPHVIDKRADASQEMPAPLSTPVQTPQSSRKSKMIPKNTTQESGPRSSGMSMIHQKAGGDVKVKSEFETQQDESFMFRARPRSHALNIEDLSPIRRMSFGRASSPAFTVSSEMDSHCEIMDLDGDTCMADDTKATSPESSAGSKGDREEALEKDAELATEHEPESESETDESQPENSGESSVPALDANASDAASPTDVEDPQNPERAQQEFVVESTPWKMDMPAMGPLKHPQPLPEDDDQSFLRPECQSPWAPSLEMMSKAAPEIVKSAFFNAARPVSPSSLSPSIFTISFTPAGKRVSEAQQPFDAEAATSSSPEPVFPIKSFKNFMSPSPERPRRRPNKISLSDGNLPSTQHLIAATTDNPWHSVPKSSKRVRWAPLLHEDDGEEGGCPQTPTGPRASSPPPEMAVADLPTGNKDQFQRHFRVVSQRKNLRHHLLPSASQQMLKSPSPMAMAEAFVAADSFRAPQGPDAVISVDTTPVPNNAESQESAMDDVDDVLRNLNEFIEMVDIETDLARAKDEEQENKRRRQQQSQSLGGTFANGLNLDGMMDAGVWN
ncbi:hypothetical protein CH063_07060 [Colletotrichum higginsianum]|uniref:Protamine P1 n=1 Tax=Colletotrichum higginsianum (strain IMI 349063) TaxID=759273 RepID=H1V4S8_COLHI|nr:hypothetical protein CH063_07060 [Colletotrichum higginsianum]